jgi:hypothetical protein
MAFLSLDRYVPELDAAAKALENCPECKMVRSHPAHVVITCMKPARRLSRGAR